MTGSTLIDITGLSKSYAAAGQTYKVLKGLDLRLDAGESLCVVGASGSGKTTLLEMLGLLSRPGAGSHRFLDQEVSRLSDRQLSLCRRRHIGFVFQAFHLLGHLSVLDNVCLPGRYAGVSRVRQRAGELLEQVGLSHRADHRPGQLSGGEQQRAAIARALMNRPRLIIADEPTGNLDPEMSNQVVDLLLDHQNGADGSGEDTGIVVVSHDARVAARFGRRARIRDGRLTELPPCR